MAINITVKEAEVPDPIPEGLYEAEVQEIEEDSGDFGDFVRVVFKITSGDHKDTLRNLIASKKLYIGSGKTSKLVGVVKALTKEEPKPGADMDLEKLVGSKCRIFVKNGKERDGIVYQNISECMPL
jgi:hypothetical protein